MELLEHLQVRALIDACGCRSMQDIKNQIQEKPLDNKDVWGKAKDFGTKEEENFDELYIIYSITSECGYICRITFQVEVI
jgi:hypothetical protein